MNTLKLEVPLALGSRRLFGTTLTGVHSLRHGTSAGVGRINSLGWLALTLSSGEAIILGGAAVPVATELGDIEVMVPRLSLEGSLPEVPKWPNGPACPWMRLPELESGLVGWQLVGFRVASETSYDSPAHDAAIALMFSGGWSLMVEASEASPATVDVWRFPSCTSAPSSRPSG